VWRAENAYGVALVKGALQDGEPSRHTRGAAAAAVHDGTIGRCMLRGSEQQLDRVGHVEPVAPFLTGAGEQCIALTQLATRIPQELLAQAIAVDREQSDDRHVERKL